jgi:hypothetical protein
MTAVAGRPSPVLASRMITLSRGGCPVRCVVKTPVFGSVSLMPGGGSREIES